jgi:uncharacterized damage-inducible protein DinB
MDVDTLLLDEFARIRQLVDAAVQGWDDDQLAARPNGTANSVAWLVWHLTRIQDDHIAGAAGTDQCWHADGWADRFGLDLDPDDTGYGHGSDQVAMVRASGALLRGYHAAVADRTDQFVRGLSAADLDRVVDENWDPPVTLGVRLVSVVSDCLQHLGQAAYARGLE